MTLLTNFVIVALGSIEKLRLEPLTKKMITSYSYDITARTLFTTFYTSYPKARMVSLVLCYTLNVM